MKYLYPKTLYKDLVKLLGCYSKIVNDCLTKTVVIAKIGIKNYNLIKDYFKKEVK